VETAGSFVFINKNHPAQTTNGNLSHSVGTVLAKIGNEFAQFAQNKPAFVFRTV
jgi:hypothetical protein